MWHALPQRARCCNGPSLRTFNRRARSGPPPNPTSAAARAHNARFVGLQLSIEQRSWRLWQRHRLFLYEIR
jgi:hypothetical protein